MKEMRALEFFLKMEVIVFKSCLQRSKSVIFKGLSDEGLVMVS